MPGPRHTARTIEAPPTVTATESWTIQVGRLHYSANKDGTMTIMASKKITINAPEVEFLEKVTVKKETTLKKTLLVEKQITTHDGVTATNDVKAGTISLQQHKHTTQGLTSPTTPPIP